MVWEWSLCAKYSQMLCGEISESWGLENLEWPLEGKASKFSLAWCRVPNHLRRSCNDHCRGDVKGLVILLHHHDGFCLAASRKTFLVETCARMSNACADQHVYSGFRPKGVSQPEMQPANCIGLGMNRFDQKSIPKSRGNEYVQPALRDGASEPKANVFQTQATSRFQPASGTRETALSLLDCIGPIHNAPASEKSSPQTLLRVQSEPSDDFCPCMGVHTILCPGRV